MIFRFFQIRCRCPQKSLCLQRGIYSRRVVAGKEARLQFADPIPAMGNYQVWIFQEVALDLHLVKLPIVQSAEGGRQASQRSYQPKLSGADVDGESEMCFVRE